MPILAAPMSVSATAFLLVAVPVLIVVAVWTGVNALRILFPERPLPFEPAGRRQRATERGESIPVRLGDILEDQARRQPSPQAGPDVPEPPASHPFFDDLWLRRN